MFKLTKLFILPGDTRRCRTPATYFWRQIRSLEIQNVSIRIFHFLQSGMVLGIVNAFSRIFDVISREKSYPTSVSFLVNLHWCQHSKVFPACWIQISDAPAQCKAMMITIIHSSKSPCLTYKSYHLLIIAYSVNNESWQVRWLNFFFFTSPRPRFLCSDNIFIAA